MCILWGTAAAKTPPKRPTPKAAVATPEATVARWSASLSLRDKVAQLVVIPFNGHPFRRSKDAAKFTNLVSKEHVGGLILVNTADGRIVAKADPVRTASFLNRYQHLAKIPLLAAGDFERGASMRIEATTIFPHAMAFAASGDPDEARQEGIITARESRAMGFNWIFFPDADVNNNPDNPIINIRSYGENPAIVSRFVSAFIDGAHSDSRYPVLVTAKHFPGHGDTATDTHANLATIPADRARLDALEWAPFRAAIKSGVDAVMTAHIAVPALDDPATPATLSKKILTGGLRGDLSFSGLIVTDALDMGGIAHGFSVGDAAVKAIEAGADVLLMPEDPKAAIDAVVGAVNAGRIPKDRIEESLKRVLTAKARLGLGSGVQVDMSAVKRQVNTPENNAVAQRIADRSITVVRDPRSLVPLKGSDTVFYTLTEGALSTEGNAFSSEILKRRPGATVLRADSAMPESALSALFEKGAGAQRYVIAAFASVAPNRGSVGLGGNLPDLVSRLIATQKPVVFVSLGNPYLLRNFPGVAAYLAAYSTVPPSEVASVKVLFGEIPASGKLPVTIPDSPPRL